MTYSPAEMARFALLYSKNLNPLRVILASLTWVLHDYFVTLEDEVRYIWTQKRGIGKGLFLFIRYYTIFLLAFDVLQIHTFAIPGVTSDGLCIAADVCVRLLGGISLWSIEVVMQIRIYALYNKSRKVAVFNGVLFIISIGALLWIMIHNALKRSALIAGAIHLPLPGCPVINMALNWALWVPATGFELVLFCFALYQSASTTKLKVRTGERMPLTAVLIGDNILYFFGVSILLILNNLMTISAVKVPWFGFGPFHAGMGIMTARMLIHLVKVSQADSICPEILLTNHLTDFSVTPDALDLNIHGSPSFPAKMPGMRLAETSNSPDFASSMASTISTSSVASSRRGEVSSVFDEETEGYASSRRDEVSSIFDEDVERYASSQAVERTKLGQGVLPYS